jgi:hypothetical protein
MRPKTAIMNIRIVAALVVGIALIASLLALPGHSHGGEGHEGH